jgi:Na+/melibiose symporter-like transporter
MTADARSSSPILWGQVCGLASVQGSIALTWVIYNLYLVELLTRLGFPQGLAAGLLVLENLLAMVMEPLMGTFSDRLQHRVGTRFPLVSLGMVLSAGCFIIIPTVLFWGQGATLRWALPVVLVAWALAMTVFRSPAMSLLGRYAFRTQLPQAASVLTLVGGVAGATGTTGQSIHFGAGADLCLCHWFGGAAGGSAGPALGRTQRSSGEHGGGSPLVAPYRPCPGGG